MANESIYLNPEVHTQLFLYAKLCEKEISGLGLVREEDGKFFCDEVALLDQEVGGAHTDISPEGVGKFMTELAKDRPDTWGHWKLWWHSHVSMTASFSGQDDTTLRELAHAAGDWFMGLVINKGGSSQLYVAIEEPFQMLGKLDEAELWTGGKEDPLIARVRKDIEEHVTVKPATVTPPLGTVPQAKKAEGKGGESSKDSGATSGTVANPADVLAAQLIDGDPERIIHHEQLDKLHAGGVEASPHTSILYSGILLDSATLSLCLVCGREVDWRNANKDNMYLACMGCNRGVGKCKCRVIRDQKEVKDTPLSAMDRLGLLRMYWEANLGIEKVSAAARSFSSSTPVQVSGRQRRRAGNARKLERTKPK